MAGAAASIGDRARVRRVRGDRAVSEARRLFRAYAASLAPFDLGYQDFEAELAGLPGAYAPPGGALFLAWPAAPAKAGRPAIGCVALRPTPDPAVGELKRLYVSPGARGTGAGRALATAAVRAARRAGYAQVVLDTLPGMTAAIALYRSIGFEPTAPYYATPVAETLFFRLEARRSAAPGTSR